MHSPDLVLICCEGKTEANYFSLLKKHFRLSNIRIVPDKDEDYHRLGQHEHLVDMSSDKREEYSKEYDIPAENIEVWAVCDRDDYKASFTKLKNYADNKNVLLAFSDPQFENYLLQHFSINNSTNKKSEVEAELTECLRAQNPNYVPYHKGNLDWLDEMIDEKHTIVGMAIKNANTFSNHTKQPFFTVQKLAERLISLVRKQSIG